MDDTFNCSLYRIENADGAPIGAAFAIGACGLLVTCTHVLKNAGWPDSAWRLTRFTTDEQLDAHVLEGHVEPANRADVAFVRVIGLAADALPHLELAPTPPPRRAQLYSYGFPESGDEGGTSGHCRVTGPARVAGQDLLAISSDEVSVGFSGGPAVDEASGLVAGMVTAISRGDRFGKGGATAFLVPAARLAALNPAAAVGTDRRVRQYRRMVRARARSPSYIIEQITTVENAAFAPPAIHEELRLADAAIDARPLPLEALISTYDRPGVQGAYLAGDAGSGKSAILRMVALGLLERRKALPVPLTAAALHAANGTDTSERVREALRASRSFGSEVQLGPDFMWDWARHLGQRFVLLIDGLDEIAERHDRNEFLFFLRDMEEELRSDGHAVLLASRDVGELHSLDRQFRRLVVDPLPEASADELIGAVLGADAAKFRRHLDRFANRMLLRSPLTLQLLLSLFVSGERTPVCSIADIYAAYLDTLQRAWRRRGLLPSAAAGHALDLLGIAAWCELAGDDIMPAEAAASEFLGEQLGLGTYAASEAARATFEALASDGGIVRGRAGKLDWVHLTFRDYLAASALHRLGNALPTLRKADLPAVQAKLVAHFWDDAANETFARFLLAFSSGKPVERTLARLVDGGDAALCFVGRAIADGSPVPDTIVTTFAKKLTQRAVACTATCFNVFTPAAADPIFSLHQLLWFEPVFSAACERLRSPLPKDEELRSQHETFRTELLQAVNRTCLPEQLARIRPHDVPKPSSGQARAAVPGS